MNLRTFGDKCSSSLLILCAAATVLFAVSGGVNAQGLNVSNGGTPSYTIPIGVPPGIGSMIPTLALQYNSGGVNGPVGYGWNIQGISLITRCAGNKRIDAKVQSVAYTGNDKLCLDGQRLIQTDASGNPLASQQGDSLGGSGMVREYRTEKDSYSRIRAYGAAGESSNGPAYFKVWTKSGQIHEYGNAGNAAINVTGKAMVTAWAVNRISDTVGNYIDFKYIQRDVAWGSGPAAGPTPGHEWQIKEVIYTGTATQQGTNRIVFDYTERPNKTAGSAQDRSEAFHQGGKNVGIWLLDKVSSYINWPATVTDKPASAVHVKSLKLAYDNGPITARSRLVNVRECVDAALSKCLPATSFNYSSGGGVNYTPNANFRNSELSTAVLLSADGKYGVLSGDFFGNGLSSILRWSQTPGENRIFRSNGDGNFTAISNGTGPGQFNLITEKLFSNDRCYASIALDFNGDGLTDILRNGACPDTRSILYLSNGDGSFRTANIDSIPLYKVNGGEQYEYKCDQRLDEQDLCPGIGGLGYIVGTYRSDGHNFHILDVNGDGLQDIVTTYLPGYSTTPTAPTDASLCASTVCTRVFLGQPNSTFVEIPTNLAHIPIYVHPNVYGPTLSNIADVNGDGLLDMLTTGVWISRGDGNFDSDGTPLSPEISCFYAMDFNGDTRPDCLSPSKNVSSQSLLVSNGITQNSTANFNLTTTGLELNSYAASGQQITGFQIADFDGDGRQDIIRWGDDAAKNRIYLSNGDGTFRTSTFNLTSSNDQLEKSDGTAQFLLGDFTGRGTTEILRLKASPSASSEASRNQLYSKADSMPPDELISVRTGNGITTSIAWVPLTNSTSSLGLRYKSDRGTPNAAAYPMVDVLSSGYVVATITSDGGFGGAQQVTEYAYSGMKMAYDGRGWLGFRNMLVQNTAPSGDLLTLTTNIIQSGPNPGAASSSETRLGALNQSGAPLLSRSTFVYCDKTAAAGAQASATSDAPCATNSKVQRPYMYQSIEEGWDLQGIGLPKVTTTNVFNNDGDAIDVLVVTASTSGQSQTSSKRATSEYHPATTDGDNWILGRLKKTTVFNDVTNSSQSLATSAGTAPLATANVGAEPEPAITPLVPSVNPAVINQIIMLLLGDD